MSSRDLDSDTVNVRIDLIESDVFMHADTSARCWCNSSRSHQSNSRYACKDAMAKSTFDIPDDPRFKATEYVVDATFQESHDLWFRWAEHYRIPWQQESLGAMYQIGSVAKRPIVACVWWARVGPSLVAFVELTSDLADFKMMEEWQHTVFPCMATFGRHANAANFGNILRNIEASHGQLGLLGDRQRINSFWMIDSERPFADQRDPQQALEWAEQRAVQWLECAEYWRTRARG